ncbi:MAG: hypothetical protein O3A46_17505 [Candidatus Poribacteria bacterium]|nr:hypothetical protein [Candidatus Poribacteria bacterium]
MRFLTLALLGALTMTATAEWTNGPKFAPDDFPIGVWVQQPRNATRFQEIGINFYLGLWNGPTEEQLATLTDAGMPVICHMNRYAREHLDNPIVIGWMHGDEPDNAQARPDGKGWGPPVDPNKIVADYHKLVEADPSRPVLLNLGQGVANDKWVGRGPEGKPED